MLIKPLEFKYAFKFFVVTRSFLKTGYTSHHLGWISICSHSIYMSQRGKTAYLNSNCFDEHTKRYLEVKKGQSVLKNDESHP